MQHKDIYIGGVGLALGEELTLADARHHGLISDAHAELTFQRAIRFADADLPLATDAAFAALDQTNLPETEIGPVYHAVNLPSSSLPYSPAAELRDYVGVDVSRHPARTIVNGDQGVIDGLADAALYLSHPSTTGCAYAIVSAGDPWPAECERWTARRALGDGAGAIVLSTQPHKARLLATATRAVARRHDLRLRPNGAGQPHDLLAAVACSALADAQIDYRDVTHLITPAGSARPEHTAVLPKANVDQRELDGLHERCRDVGSLGAADLIAGLDWLNRQTGSFSDGDYILLLASGLASVGAAVIQVHR